MDNFKQKLMNFLTKVRRKLNQWFKHIKKNLFGLSKINEYADEAPTQKPLFFLGTLHLTFSSILKYLFIAIVFGGFLAVGMGIGFAAGILRDQPVPTFAQMDKQINHPEHSASLYYADNKKIATVRSDVTTSIAKKEDISPLIKKAIVATEDENFYSHKGVLPKSLIRAVFSELTGIGTSTGGSTLTQQLVKTQFLTDQTTWKRKIIEMFFARKIERHFDKEEIISAYLNVVPFGKNNSGENIAGINEAAKGIFGKDISDLSVPEAAFIAGLPQSPSVYTPYDSNGEVKDDLALGLRRKDIVLFRMYRNNDLTKVEYEAAKNYNLKKDFLEPADKKVVKNYDDYLYNLVTNKSAELLANNLIEQDNEDIKDIQNDDAKYQNYLFQASQLLKEKGYHVFTTIQKDLYDIMSDTAKNAQIGATYTSTVFDDNLNTYVNVVEKPQNGSVMIDNKTGKVIAFAGGVDFETSQINHAFDTYRSPGSSIKPYLVYAPAVENKIISSKTPLPDFPTRFGKYIPTDYGNTVENRFINSDEALAMSYNLPAVNLYDRVLKDTPVKEYMSKLGFNISNSEYEELGLSLGGTRNGFSVADNAAAFATFNNNGEHVDPYYIDKIVDPSGKVVYQHEEKREKVFSPGTAYVMQKMLHEVTTTGTASQLDYSLNFDTKNLIGKTGTSNDYRDIWFNGATPGVTITSWMGYDNFYGHSYNLSENASTINLNFWAEMTNKLYKAAPKLFKLNQGMKRPSTVKKHSVLKSTGTKPGTVEFNGNQISLNGYEVNAWSLMDKAPEATPEFSINAHKKNYKLFYNFISGAGGNYGTKLYYTGKTINDQGDIDQLFSGNGQPDTNSDYYGQANKNPSEDTQEAEVNGNDEEPETSGGNTGNETSSQPSGNTEAEKPDGETNTESTTPNTGTNTTPPVTPPETGNGTVPPVQ